MAPVDHLITLFADHPLVSTLLPLGSGMMVGYFTGPKRTQETWTWYEGLKKPAFSPPNWAPGIAWTLLYSGMGYAAHLVCAAMANAPLVSNADARKTRWSVSLYLLQLGFNLAWVPLFFYKRLPKLALYDIAGMTSSVIVTTVLWWNLERKAAYLMLPYIAWSCYASYLNFELIALNGTAALERGGSKAE